MQPRRVDGAAPARDRPEAAASLPKLSFFVAEQDQRIAHAAYGFGPTLPAFIEHIFESNVGLECLPAGDFKATIHENLPLGSIVEQVDSGLGEVEYYGPGPEDRGPPGKNGQLR